MKRNFIKLIFAVLFTAITSNVMAQEKGDIAVGANLGLNAGKVVIHSGYGAQIQYNITNIIRLETSYTYYNDAARDIPYINEELVFGSWECGVNIHCLIKPTGDIENLSFLDRGIGYPFVGIGFLNTKASFTEKNNKDNSESFSANAVGLNLGYGVDLNLINNLSLGFQIKYMFVSPKLINIESDTDVKLGGRYMVSLGLIYKL